jgi:putative ABC transport system permease protein
MWQQFASDVRYSARALRNARLLTIATVVTLGIGIGLLTAIFSIVNAAVLRPLPYDDARRLVAVTEADPRDRSRFSSMAPAAFMAVRDQNRSFSTVAAYEPRSLNVVVANSTVPLSGADVTANLFSTLRVVPARGRLFSADEANADARVLLISHEFWATRLGANETIVGTTARVDGTPYTIIGVLPAGFNFPNRQHFWRPLVLRPEGTDWMERSVEVVARLRDGVAFAAARSEVATIGAVFAREHPSTREGWSMQLRSEMLERRAIPGPLPWMVLAAGLFMLLIACANVATMLLARAAARRAEMAVRAALGANRWRLVSQHLTETLLLALAGGVAGVLIAMWTLDVAQAILPLGNMPSWLDFSIDWRVLLFTLGVALLALIAVGVGPALVATRVRLSDPLKIGSFGETASRKELRASRVLVVVEVAAAFILFAGSALMVRSAGALRNFDFGIDAAHVLSARPWLSTSQYATAARRDAYFAEAVNRVGHLPGIRAVAVAGEGVDSIRGAAWMPDSSGTMRERYSITPRGGEQTAWTYPDAASVRWRVVSGTYFAAVGLSPRRGHTFNAQDREGAARVAVVSERVAERLWPNVDPVGRQFRLGGSGEWITVVGVVPNVHVIAGGGLGVSGRFESTIYLPSTQATTHYGAVLVRTVGDPVAAIDGIRRVMAEIDRDQSISRIERLSDSLGSAASTTRWLGMMFAAIAIGALVLASIGLYGVIAYSVARRTREIGVRMALGADARTLRRTVMAQALRLTTLGLLIGMGGAWGLVGLMRSFLYGVTAYDPSTYLAAALLFLVVSALASLVPARRATQVDPLIALRAQ